VRILFWAAVNLQSKRAIKEYLQLIEKSPRDERLRLKLGDEYLKNGEAENAVKEYLEAADLYQKEDYSAKAIAIYKRVVSIDPNHIEGIHRMASLYLRQGLLGDARVYYEKILKIKPGDQEAIRALSVIEDSKRPKQVQALLQMEETLSLEPVNPAPSGSTDGAGISSTDKDSELHYHLGIGYKGMGLFEYAISEFELALNDPSLKFNCYILLGECFKEKGDAEQSAKYFELACKIKKRPKGLRLDPTS
jgi:tetratricopeptide (TPR) repeat protein